MALGAVHDGIGDLLDAVSNGAVRDLSHTQLAGLVVSARAAAARLESAVLTVVAEVDAGGSHPHDGELTTTGRGCGWRPGPPEETAATVRTARVLRSATLPTTAVDTAAPLLTGDRRTAAQRRLGETLERSRPPRLPRTGDGLAV